MNEDSERVSPRRILVLDSGPGVARVVAKAQSLGHSAILFTRGKAPNTHGANEVIEGDCFDYSQIAKVTKHRAIDGVFSPLDYSSFIVALAKRPCTLPSVGVAMAMQYKHIGFGFLAKSGVPSPELRAAETAGATREAAREFGMPAWIGTSETYSQTAIHEVQHVEDLSLAYTRVTRHSMLKTAIIMRPVRGRAFYVDGVVVDGAFLLSGVIERDFGEAPFLFDRALFAPAALSLGERDAVVGVAVKALDALKCRNGCVHVGVVLTDAGPVVMDVFGAPAAVRFPADLLLLAHGTDTIGNAVRFALGEAPEFGAGAGRSAALYWIPTHSGVVTEIRGVEEARGIPGIEAVVVGVGPGDAMRHVVDCESRDRVGYVLAAGDDAMAAARSALAVIEIVTKPSY